MDPNSACCRAVSFKFLKEFIKTVPPEYTTADVVFKMVVPATKDTKVRHIQVVIKVVVLLYEVVAFVVCIKTKLLCESPLGLSISLHLRSIARIYVQYCSMEETVQSRGSRIS